MAVQMSILLDKIPGWDWKAGFTENVKRKMEFEIGIPENENVLVYKETPSDQNKTDRNLEEALDFMVDMTKKTGRKILSHSVTYEVHRGYSQTYIITMILEPV